MEKVKGQNLGVTFLFHTATKLWTDVATVETPTIDTHEQLLDYISAFKESLKLLKTIKIKRKTQDQS